MRSIERSATYVLGVQLVRDRLGEGWLTRPLIGRARNEIRRLVGNADTLVHLVDRREPKKVLTQCAE